MENYAPWFLLVAVVVVGALLYRFWRARSATPAEPESPMSDAEAEDLDSSHIAFRSPLLPPKDDKPRR